MRGRQGGNAHELVRLGPIEVSMGEVHGVGWNCR